ncbi:MAG: hypothetical protein QOG05_4455 [Streptosporangiaceae bacterium]|nr:hypothetical protein [Streptosporangiaceae bacterium]
MTTDDELLTAVRESFAGARLSTPLDATIRRGRTLRARRRTGGLAAAIVLAAGLTVAGLVSSGAGQPAPPAGPTPPATLAAWTVTKGAGHTLTILVRQLRDPAGLQRTLRADGVPAAVAFQGGTLSLTPPLPRACHAARMPDQANAELQGRIIGPGISPDPRVIALVIHAAEIPRGIGLNLTVRSGGSGYGWSLGLVQASPACTGS